MDTRRDDAYTVQLWTSCYIGGNAGTRLRTVTASHFFRSVRGGLPADPNDINAFVSRTPEFADGSKCPDIRPKQAFRASNNNSAAGLHRPAQGRSTAVARRLRRTGFRLRDHPVGRQQLGRYPRARADRLPRHHLCSAQWPHLTAKCFACLPSTPYA